MSYQSRDGGLFGTSKEVWPKLPDLNTPRLCAHCRDRERAWGDWLCVSCRETREERRRQIAYELD